MLRSFSFIVRLTQSQTDAQQYNFFLVSFCYGNCSWRRLKTNAERRFMWIKSNWCDPFVVIVVHLHAWIGFSPSWFSLWRDSSISTIIQHSKQKTKINSFSRIRTTEMRQIKSNWKSNALFKASNVYCIRIKCVILVISIKRFCFCSRARFFFFVIAANPDDCTVKSVWRWSSLVHKIIKVLRLTKKKNISFFSVQRNRKSNEIYLWK